MSATRRRILIIALLSALFVLYRWNVHPWVRLPLAAFFTLFVPGLSILSIVARTSMPFSLVAGFSLVLSPLLVVFPAYLWMTLGTPPVTISLDVIAVYAVLLVALCGRLRVSQPGRGRWSTLGRLWVFVALIVVLSFHIHAVAKNVPYQMALIEQANALEGLHKTSRLGIDPSSYNGVMFFHIFLMVLRVPCGVSLKLLLPFLSVVCFLGFVLVLRELLMSLGRLGGPPESAILVLVLLYNLPGSLVALLGPASERLCGFLFPGGGALLLSAGQADQAGSYGLVLGSLFTLFGSVSPFVISLGSFIAAYEVLLTGTRWDRRSKALLVALLTLGGVLFSPVVLIVQILILAALFAATTFGRSKWTANGSKTDTPFLALLAFLNAVLVVPVYYLVMSGSGAYDDLVQWKDKLMLLACGGGLFAFYVSLAFRRMEAWERFMALLPAVPMVCFFILPVPAYRAVESVFILILPLMMAVSLRIVSDAGKAGPRLLVTVAAVLLALHLAVAVRIELARSRCSFVEIGDKGGDHAGRAAGVGKSCNRATISVKRDRRAAGV